MGHMQDNQIDSIVVRAPFLDNVPGSKPFAFVKVRSPLCSLANTHCTKGCKQMEDQTGSGCYGSISDSEILLTK